MGKESMDGTSFTVAQSKDKITCVSVMGHEINEQDKKISNVNQYYFET